MIGIPPCLVRWTRHWRFGRGCIPNMEGEIPENLGGTEAAMATRCWKQWHPSHLSLFAIKLHRIRSGSSKIGQQMMLLHIVFFEQMDRTTSAVYSSGLLCEHATANLILPLGRCDIADVLWAQWMMKEALVPVSKGSKWGFTFHIFLAKFLSDRFPVYLATSSTHSVHRLQKKSQLPLCYNGISINISVLRTVAVFEDGWAWGPFCAVLLCRVVDFNIAFWTRWTRIWFGHWSMVSPIPLVKA